VEVGGFGGAAAAYLHTLLYAANAFVCTFIQRTHLQKHKAGTDTWLLLPFPPECDFSPLRCFKHFTLRQPAFPVS